MTINKLALSLLAICLSIQCAFAQLAIMPEAGINLSNLAYNGNVINNKSTSGKYKAGIRTGISIVAPMGKVTFFQPGLFYSNKGCKDASGNAININYLEIPLNLGYISNFRKGGSFFMTAGPYFGFGLANEKLDIGMNFGMGYKMPFGVFLRAQYGIGFQDISSSTYSPVITNHGFAFSTGYYYTIKTAAQKTKAGSHN